MATKHKTAEQAQDITTANPAAETGSQAAVAVKQEAPASQENVPPLGPDGKYHTLREPGDDAQKSWVKKASVIVDPEAGVKFHFDYDKHKAIITFDAKPTPEQLTIARPLLNEGGFEWDRVEKDGWKKKIQFTQREDDRRQAKKTFYTVANAIREQKGLPARNFGEVMAF
jgi:hypothetical protein